MLHTEINTLLAERSASSRIRQLRSIKANGATEIVVNGNKLISFASNDYLSLSQHAWLKEQAIKAIEQYGVGCPSSRLIAGNCELYEIIENKLAKLKSTETALIFPTGFQTNITILLTLAKLKTRLIGDSLSHNSILLGMQFNKRHFARFAHNSIKDLLRLLNNNTEADRTTWIITESVFSMDGDLAPIDQLMTISEQQNCYLYIDEAHATGVFGHNGMGLVENPNDKTIVMGTFGKGCGGFGAYIACSKQFRDFLINFCPGLIYTTALPPPVLGSILAALDMIPLMVQERKDLLKQAKSLRGELRQIGFNTGKSESQIVCLHLDSEQEALSLSEYLEKNNIYAPAIRPPTVPENESRIRLSLSASHKDSDLEYLLNTLRRWHASKR